MVHKPLSPRVVTQALRCLNDRHWGAQFSVWQMARSAIALQKCLCFKQCRTKRLTFEQSPSTHGTQIWRLFLPLNAFKCKSEDMMTQRIFSSKQFSLAIISYQFCKMDDAMFGKALKKTCLRIRDLYLESNIQSTRAASCIIDTLHIHATHWTMSVTNPYAGDSRVQHGS